MSTALKEKLDTVERSKLRKLESVVAEGISSFVVVGEALKEIRDAKLYRESHKTFEKYVDDKWSMGRSYANRLIASADVSKVLVPMGTKNERVAEINTERQIRELKDVPAESMEAVVNKAADIAGDDPITASDIKQARKEVLATPKDAWEDVDEEPEPEKPIALTKDDPFFEEKDHVAAIHSLTKLGDEWLRKIKVLTTDKGGEYLAFEVQEIDDLIKRVKLKMRQSTFAHVCVDCKGNGKKCGKCKQLGWLCKGSLEFLDQRQKDLLGVA